MYLGISVEAVPSPVGAAQTCWAGPSHKMDGRKRLHVLQNQERPVCWCRLQGGRQPRIEATGCFGGMVIQMCTWSA